MEELKNEIYDKDNGFWYKRDGDCYFPEYYLGKELSIEEATRLKEQRVKKDTGKYYWIFWKRDFRQVWQSKVKLY